LINASVSLPVHAIKQYHIFVKISKYSSVKYTGEIHSLNGILLYQYDGINFKTISRMVSQYHSSNYSNPSKAPLEYLKDKVFGGITFWGIAVHGN